MQVPFDLPNIFSSPFYFVFVPTMVFTYVGTPIGLILLFLLLKSKNKKIKDKLRKWMIICFASGPLLFVVCVLILAIELLLIFFGILPKDSFNY